MRNFLLLVVVLAVASLAAAQTGIPCPDSVNRQCPTSAGTALFLPHPNDCSKYCECVMEGLAYELQCPDGLMWDEVRNSCDWWYNVDCGSRPKP
ncbi:uncharacterized protein LOC123510826 [Portunus trituberculatus]|uniref:uncharacterized protein LOC123510826 n=1 Tax=Portunus trituberculatus TaxID=210409 RepID=UPI001E1CD2B9|nr:uncharacterized protein LOC123510826 [Portunus trituberculatus]